MTSSLANSLDQNVRISVEKKPNNKTGLKGEGFYFMTSLLVDPPRQNKMGESHNVYQKISREELKPLRSYIIIWC